MNVKLIAIAALGKNREIGLNGRLPWSLPEEYQHFKSTVKGKYVLISRKNFELHGCEVVGSHALVLSRDRNYHHANAQTFATIEDVIAFVDSAQIPDLYVIGGTEIYKLALPYLSEFLWSEIDYSGPADSYFPDFSQFEWTLASEQSHPGWKMRRMLKIPQMPD